jgi:hypothetical protein
VDFCATNNAKIPIIGAAFGVCGVKNRLIGDFLRFYVRSATNSQAITESMSLVTGDGDITGAPSDDSSAR